MSEKVLVIDPGERVGWAKAEIIGDEIFKVSNGVAPLKNFALKLYSAISGYDTVVYETWRLRPDKAKQFIGNDFQPSQLIGMIRLLSWLEPSVKLVSLGPDTKTTGRKVMPDILRERLEHSSEEHDKDALDLLSYYWFKNYV